MEIALFDYLLFYFIYCFMFYSYLNAMMMGLFCNHVVANLLIIAFKVAFKNMGFCPWAFYRYNRHLFQ